MTQPLDRWLFWFVGGAVFGGALAWIAFQVQQEGIAPAVLFPLAVGLLLGVLLTALARWLDLRLGNMAIAVAACGGLLVPIGQDYIGHRERLRAYGAELARQHPLAAAVASESLRPTFADHARGKFQSAPTWWTLDAMLTALAAACVVAYGRRARAVIPHEPTPELHERN